jgi:O-antigen/teichoic acid export membrane protein
VLSGSEFLPHGAVVLQILIWSIVFGWINSLTNYVLIALNRQRYVLLASGARVIFTIAANVLLVRAFSYTASGWILVAGEFLLVLLFYVGLRRHLGPVGWPSLLWRPVLAALVMGGAVWAASTIHPALALAAGVVVYPIALLLMRAITPEERAMLAPLLPEPVRLRLKWEVKP